jgi:hypothetical protein
MDIDPTRTFLAITAHGSFLKPPGSSISLNRKT